MTSKHLNCEICGSLKDHEYIYYKDGDDNVHKLPDAFGKLEEGEMIVPSTGRKEILMICPVCKTHYHYRTDYEFFPNGSENEEWLDRLTDKEAKKLLELFL